MIQEEKIKNMLKIHIMLIAHCTQTIQKILYIRINFLLEASSLYYFQKKYKRVEINVILLEIKTETDFVYNDENIISNLISAKP